MNYPPAPLEVWLRDYYFTAEINICSSGVEPYTVRQLRQLTRTDAHLLDELLLDDGYSYGTPALRQAVADRWGTGDAGRVLTANGSNEALSLVLTALLRPGDEVVVVRPGYHSLEAFAESMGCRTRTWGLSFDGAWSAAVADLEGLLTPSTRAVIVNFPHNPTGGTVGQAEMDEVMALAASVDAYVLWDAAFNDLVFDGVPLAAPTSLYERAIGVGTMSKAYGLPGLRFGWAIGPPDLLAACVQVRDWTTLHVSPVVELLAQRAVDHIDALLAPRLEQARKNREVFADWVADHADQVELTLPEAGVAAFPRLVGVGDVDDFVQHVYDRYGVLVVPGSCFGSPDHVRLGFGGPPDELAEGLGRIGEALDDRAG